ncbi:MAG: hypothetical protein SF097_20220 [Acidobacteriota bacterium]|nr:hypothetical protein [Acidobacteriota bacterium]
MKKDSAKFDLLKRYLLGQLAEQQMREIEQRYLADEEFFNELLRVESDLIDQYTNGQFPPEERKQFEDHFLRSAERRKRAAQAESRARASSQSPNSKRTSWWRRCLARLGRKH